MHTLTLLLAVPACQERPRKVPAQAHPKVDPLRVDTAIDDGVKFLRTQLQAMERPFVHASEQGAPEPNYVELVLWTWLHAGVSEDDPDFDRMPAKTAAGKVATTYKVSLQALILQKLNLGKYQWRIAQCAQFLVDNQCESGQWCTGHETEVGGFQLPKEEPKVETEGSGKPADNKKRGDLISDSVPSARNSSLENRDPEVIRRLLPGAAPAAGESA